MPEEVPSFWAVVTLIEPNGSDRIVTYHFETNNGEEAAQQAAEFTRHLVVRDLLTFIGPPTRWRVNAPVVEAIE